MRLSAEDVAAIAAWVECDPQHHRVSFDLPAQTVVVCAGQEPNRGLEARLREAGIAVPVHRVGGADVAAELDAKRAIDQGTRLAARL